MDVKNNSIVGPLYARWRLHILTPNKAAEDDQNEDQLTKQGSKIIFEGGVLLMIQRKVMRDLNKIEMIE